MKISNTIGRGIACAGLSLVLAGGVALPLRAFAANGQCQGQCEKPGKVSQRAQEFRAMRQKFLAEAKSDDATLQKLIQQLNSAPESQKTDIEAQILNQIASQHHQMLTQWESVHARMAQLRKEHVQTSRRVERPGEQGTANQQGTGGQQ